MHNSTTRLDLPLAPDDQTAAIAAESGLPSDDILLSTSQSILASSSRTSSSSFPRGNGLDGDSNFDSRRLATAPSYPLGLPGRPNGRGLEARTTCGCRVRPQPSKPLSWACFPVPTAGSTTVGWRWCMNPPSLPD